MIQKQIHNIASILHPRNRRIILWSAFFVVILLNILFYVFIVQNNHQQTFLYQKMYAQKRIQQDGASGNVHTDQLKFFNREKSKLEQLKKRLFHKIYFGDSVRGLYTMVQQSGLTVNKMVFIPDYLADLNIWKYTTTLSVEGEYQKIRRLLANVQNSPNLLCIHNLSLIKKSDESKDVKMVIGISTYLKEN